MRLFTLLVSLAATTALTLPLRAAVAAERSASIKDSFFTPVFLVVTVGDSVTWLNRGQLAHTVTSFPSTKNGFDSSPQTESVCDDANPLTEEGLDCVQPGQSFTVEFGTPGTYSYYCKVHGNTARKPDGTLSAQMQPCAMCGQIVVKEKRTAPRRVRQSATPTPRETSTSSPTATAEPSPSPSPSIPVPGETTDESPVAAPAGEGPGSELLLALLALLALGVAAYATWRRFLARP